MFPKGIEPLVKAKVLRQRLQDLIVEQDELINIECVNIKTKYLVLFGFMEYRLISLSIDEKRLRRKIAMVQGLINRQETIDSSKLEEIDRKLDEEFKLYMNMVQRQLEDLEEAINLDELNSLSGEKLQEFKKMYRFIVKKLHPDLNPNQGYEEASLFQKAQLAYQLGSYQIMESIYQILLDKMDNFEMSVDPRDEVNRLEKLCRDMENSISRIKSRFPYTEKNLVSDDQLIENKKMELKHKISYFEIIDANLSKQLGEIIKNA